MPWRSSTAPNTCISIWWNLQQYGQLICCHRLSHVRALQPALEAALIAAKCCSQPTTPLLSMRPKLAHPFCVATQLLNRITGQTPTYVLLCVLCRWCWLSPGWQQPGQQQLLGRAASATRHEGCTLEGTAICLSLPHCTCTLLGSSCSCCNRRRHQGGPASHWRCVAGWQLAGSRQAGKPPATSRVSKHGVPGCQSPHQHPVPCLPGHNL